MNTLPGDTSASTTERRNSDHLREIFEHACQIAAPFFDPAQGWGGMSLTMYARQALREAYPELIQQDVAMLFSAVQRHYREIYHQK